MILGFEAGGDPYGVDVTHVERLVPRVRLRRLPHAPEHCPGLLAYRGRAVPVVDLALMVGGKPAAERLSTRILLLNVPDPRPGAPGRVGLIAERVRDLQQVEDTAIAYGETPLQRVQYLGPFLRIDGRLVQLIEPDALITEALEAVAAAEPSETETRNVP